MKLSLNEAENAVAIFLHNKDSEYYFVFPNKVYDCIGSLLAERPERDISDVTKDELACTNILIRIMQDLRCVQICATSGYAPAAGTLAASIFELSYEIAFLAGRPDRAEKWFAHTNIKKTAEEHHNRLGSVLAKEFSDPAERAPFTDAEWDNYAFLSALKHGNSAIQQYFGVEDTLDGVTFTPLPSQSDLSVNTTNVVFYRACQYALRGVAYFANIYLDVADREAGKVNFEQLSVDLKRAFLKLSE
jgi:hypothetical protein